MVISDSSLLYGLVVHFFLMPNGIKALVLVDTQQFVDSFTYSWAFALLPTSSFWLLLKK